MEQAKVTGTLVECSEISLEYEDFRLKDSQRERVLLGSIAERGVLEALWGIERISPDGLPTRLVLLDGFKRLRCAKKLSIQSLPWRSIGEDEAQGLLCLLAISNARGLHILEQSKMVDSLHRQFNLGVNEIASRLEKSTAWVSVRLGVLSEMPASVRDEIFSGRFPARSYFYTLNHFTRVKGVPKKEIKAFVGHVSGKRLSGRQVDLLASGYFQGSPEMRQQIEEGKFQIALATLQDTKTRPELNDLNDYERGLIRDLEITVTAGNRILVKSASPKLVNPGFFVQAEILIGNLTRSLPDLSQSLEKLYDRCREKKNSISASRSGGPQKGDRPAVEA